MQLLGEGPHPIHLSVVLSLPYGQREELLGPGGVHEMKIEGKKKHVKWSFLF